MEPFAEFLLSITLVISTDVEGNEMTYQTQHACSFNLALSWRNYACKYTLLLQNFLGLSNSKIILSEVH